MLSTEKTAAHGGGAVAKIRRKRLIELGFVTRCVQFAGGIMANEQTEFWLTLCPII